MWRQLSEASTPVDYPTNHQSFCNSWEDESACWITSRACWCLFFCSPSRAAPGWGPESPISSSTLCHLAVQATPQQRLAQTMFWSLLKAEGEQLQAQMVFLYIGLSVCLSVIRQVWLLCICFLLSTLACTCQDSTGGSVGVQLTLTYKEWGGQACMHACHMQLCTDAQP